ncbi:DUF1642 domain-containing protein [Enterococcus asini]|uniref:DUF1642 domain-containing protein n=1 Tax=Enterococcus asini TaxID=57732 RepID=A0AAW8TX91_9ENTE|nr:DUF1642 domain-containing protein [Enterococcus asini]MDT2810046.1 DUF1642 domain-containing protein [Enterococcus asini]
MKVSEAIDRLEIGDTVWAKATVNAINFEGGYIRAENTKTSIYLDGNAEISLEEPQAEKVVVPDWFDQWYKAVKNDSVYSEETALKLINQCGWGHMLEYPSGENVPDSNMTEWINENRLLANRAILDGYTVKPKRWVVKNKKHGSGLESFINGTVKPMWTTEEPLWMTFTDKSKAEAVATLVEGSVEEV